MTAFKFQTAEHAGKLIPEFHTPTTILIKVGATLQAAAATGGAPGWWLFKRVCEAPALKKVYLKNRR